MDGNVKRIATDFSALGGEKEERVFIGVSVMLSTFIPGVLLDRGVAISMDFP